MISLQLLFPLLALAFTVLAWVTPDALLAWEYSPPTLLLILMFVLGLNLRLQDFQRVLRKPERMAIGVVLQFILMPLSGWLLSLAVPLTDAHQAGLLLTATASASLLAPAFVFLASGDLALAVAITILGNLWGIIIAPWLTPLVTNLAIETQTSALLLSLLPPLLAMAAGMFCLQWLPTIRQRIHSYIPAVVIGLLLAMMAIQTASLVDLVSMVPVQVWLAVILLNLAGLGAAFWICRQQGLTLAEQRTISLQTGLQAALPAAALANHLSGLDASLVPFIMVIWQGLSAAILAGFWYWQTQQQIRQIRRNPAVSRFDPGRH